MIYLHRLSVFGSYLEFFSDFFMDFQQFFEIKIYFHVFMNEIKMKVYVKR